MGNGKYGFMRENNIILEKSKKFAIRVVRLYQYLTKEKVEFVLSKQLLRSGTSVGANVKEAHDSISKADFKAKMYIALKEASETEYWLELLVETSYITREQFESIYVDCQELRKLLSSITKTLKEKAN